MEHLLSPGSRLRTHEATRGGPSAIFWHALSFIGGSILWPSDAAYVVGTPDDDQLWGRYQRANIDSREKMRKSDDLVGLANVDVIGSSGKKLGVVTPAEAVHPAKHGAQQDSLWTDENRRASPGPGRDKMSAMNSLAPELIARRLDLLSEFRNALVKWFNLAGAYNAQNSTECDDARVVVNRHMLAARQAVRDLGFQTVFVMFGSKVEAFSSAIFNEAGGADSLARHVVDLIEQAIGAYESLRDQTGLVRVQTRETIDVVDAIERALRPQFKGRAPDDENDVQDKVEAILLSLGVRYTRDRETIMAGARATRPDFVLTDLDTALEVKFARGKLGASAIQEQIHADITAYRTRWRHLLFVVYDLGVIDDPHAMARENQRLFGVRVMVVKH